MMTRVFLLPALLAGALAGADNPELGGRVIDAQSAEPIARAHVTVHFYQPGQQGSEVALLSDTDGSFHMTNVPTGQYQVTCEKAGYLSSSQGMQAIAGGANSKPVPMVIRLTAQAALEGTVQDDQGAPVPFANIQLVRQQVANGRRQIQPAAGGSADETGYFRLFSLPAGRYYVAITASVNGVRRAKSMAYPPLFYPNTTDVAAAQPFDLKAGDEIQIQIKLPEPVPAREIRGTVAAAGENVNLMLTRQPASQSPLPVNVVSRWDAKTRTFRISQVTPGMYLLTAGVQDGKNWLQAGTMVTVRDADVTGLRLEPSDTGIDGIVRVEGAASPVRQVAFISLQGEHNSMGGPVDADGKFHIPNLLPDTYRVNPQGNGSSCVQSILEGGRDVRDGLVVTADGAPATLEIALTTHCGTVEATLALADSSRPPQNLMAVLLRKAGSELVLEKQSFGGGRLGATTPMYQFQGVTPGDYTLYVWPQEGQIEYADAEYMRQYESYGQAVSVTADAKVSVTVDRVLTPAKN